MKKTNLDSQASTVANPNSLLFLLKNRQVGSPKDPKTHKSLLPSYIFVLNEGLGIEKNQLQMAEISFGFD